MNAEIDLVDRGRVGLRPRRALEPQRHPLQQRTAHPGRLGKQLPRGDEETDTISRALPNNCYGSSFVSQDTEFPGIIANRCEVDQRYYSEQECEYFLVKRNVEETKMIQIGLSIADENGATPLPTSTWQFNFRFDKEKDRIVDQSYDLLIKAGVRFDRLAT